MQPNKKKEVGYLITRTNHNERYPKKKQEPYVYVYVHLLYNIKHVTARKLNMSENHAIVGS